MVADRASRFAFAYAPKSNDSRGLEPFETSSRSAVPLSITTDARGKFTADTATHLCQWVDAQLYHGPSDRPRGQAAVTRMGKWHHDLLQEVGNCWEASPYVVARREE